MCGHRLNQNLSEMEARKLKFGAGQADGEHLPESQDEGMSQGWSSGSGGCKRKLWKKL